MSAQRDKFDKHSLGKFVHNIASFPPSFLRTNRVFPGGILVVKMISQSATASAIEKNTRNTQLPYSRKTCYFAQDIPKIRFLCCLVLFGNTTRKRSKKFYALFIMHCR